MRFIVTFNSDALQREIEGLDALAAGEFRAQLAAALDKVGAEVHAAIIEPLKLQTGLTTSTIPRAVHDVPASADSLAYTLMTRGGDISLRWYGAHEEGSGVVARPRGQRKFYAGAFVRSGRKSKRYAVEKLNKQAYEPLAGKTAKGEEKGKSAGGWWRKMKKQKSGVLIPEEMMRGAAKAAFERVVATELPPQVGRVLTLAGRGL